RGVTGRSKTRRRTASSAREAAIAAMRAGIDPHALAAALRAVFGEPHTLADPDGGSRRDLEETPVEEPKEMAS
ncbi:MAG: hypothetical protein L0H93_07590, partial [Nocardioides sp.]|nr:hypothetical protein [Nocardioides sp.]